MPDPTLNERLAVAPTLELTSRALDARLAELLGWREVRVRVYNDGSQGEAYGLPPDQNKVRYVVPHYSTDGNAMLALLEELRGRGYYVAIGCAHGSNMQSAYICDGPPAGAGHKDTLLHLHREEEFYEAEKGNPRLETRQPAFATARTVPAAVALAALTVLEGERK